MKNNVRFTCRFITPADRAFFAQYIEVRRRAYLTEYPWLPSTFGGEDSTDHASIIAVALENESVAAGGRLTISTPQAFRPMPLEETGFRLASYGPAEIFQLDHNPYGEISRVAVDPGLSRGFEGSYGVGDMLCRAAAEQGLDVVFCICPEKPARINAMNAKRRGVPFRRFEELDTVFGPKMLLCAFDRLRDYYGAQKRSAA